MIYFNNYFSIGIYDLKVLGICISGGKIVYSILSGTYEEPTLEKQFQSTILGTNNIGELMDWFESEFISKINSDSFDLIAYCISDDSSKKQYSSNIFPFAILNKLAFDKKTTVIEKSQRNFNNKKTTTNRKITEDCISRFNLPPSVKVKQRSIMAAWCVLPNE